MSKLKSAVLYEYLTKVKAIGIFYLIQYLIVALIFTIVAICTKGNETGSNTLEFSSVVFVSVIGVLGYKEVSLLIGVGISGIILLVMALFQFVFSDEIVSKAMELTMRAVGFMSDGTINQFFPILSFLIIGALFGIGSYAVIRRTELK